MILPTETLKFKTSYANGNILVCYSQLGTMYYKQHVLRNIRVKTFNLFSIIVYQLLCDIKKHVMHIMQLYSHVYKK